MTRRRAPYLAAMVAAAALLACAAAFVAVPNEAGAAFPGQNGRIAYSNFDDGAIRTIDPRGGGGTEVARGSNPSYSPDGRRIAYSAREEIDGEKLADDIFTIGASGGTPVQVTNDYRKDDYDPSWSPDGKRIVYTGYEAFAEGYYELYKVAPAGGQPLQITDGNFGHSLASSWGSRP